jgi:hypothetical protein
MTTLGNGKPGRRPRRRRGAPSRKPGVGKKGPIPKGPAPPGPPRHPHKVPTPNRRGR